MKIHLVILTSLFIVFHGCSGGSSSGSRQPTGIVQLASGPIVGYTENGIDAFLGIPYAAPPIGDLRWKPPEDVASWQETVDATSFGYSCPQAAGITDYGATSEDCLYLNVWSPENNSGNSLPVMVWIHGGAFAAGGSNFPPYDGKHLAARNVVIVTINYRLGPLGFLAHEALSVESTNSVSGNYGLLDQIKALEWVQTNIQAFGGDPENVTIFGESAGAVSVTFQMISPLAAGLFDRAIAESGTTYISNYYYPESDGTLADAMTTGAEFATALGCTDEDQVLACMRAISAEQVIETAAFDPSSYYVTNFPFRPIVDGWVVPDNPEILFNSGEFNKVPLVTGTNANEGTLFISGTSSVDDYESWVELIYGDNAAAVLAYFPATQDDYLEVFDRLYTITLFAKPAKLVATFVTNAGQRVYSYQLARIPRTAEAEVYGAYHGLDIAYVFGTLTEAGGYDSTDLTLSSDIMSYWVDFATTGDPNGYNLTEWTAYDVERPYMNFGDTDVIEYDLFKDECDFLDSLPD